MGQGLYLKRVKRAYSTEKQIPGVFRSKDSNPGRSTGCGKSIRYPGQYRTENRNYWYPEIEQKVADLVKKAEMEELVIYSSFNHYSVQQMKKIVPEAKTAYLYSDVILNVAEYAKNTKVDGLHPAVYHVKMADFLKEYLDSKSEMSVSGQSMKKRI